MTIAAPRRFSGARRIDVSQIIVWTIGGALLAVVLIGSVLTLRAGHYTSAQWRDFIVFGIAQGAIYALIALGYTMVYGVLRMINFAHGEVFMSGAMSTFFLADYFNRSGFLKSHPWISLVVMLLFSGLVSMTVAVLVERIAYRPLRGAPRLVPLITAVGASFFLQYTFRGLFGSGVRAYPSIPVLQGNSGSSRRPKSLCSSGSSSHSHCSCCSCSAPALAWRSGLSLRTARLRHSWVSTSTARS